MAELAEAYALGLGDPVPLSAGTARASATSTSACCRSPRRPRARGDPAEDRGASKPLQLAIVGRPNVGKSTLVNRLLGEERVLTGPEPGITRDAIAIDWAWNGRPIRLIDTAGMRRRARVEERLERLSVADTLRAVRFAGTVVLVIDAQQPLERQDLTIANLVAEEGRALVLAVNKWDLVRDRGPALAATAREAGGQPAAAQGGGAGAGLGADRHGPRRADAGGVGGRRGVEQAGADAGAQPLAGGDPGASPAAGGRRAGASGCAT